MTVSISKLYLIFLWALLYTQRENVHFFFFFSALDLTLGVLESRGRPEIPGPDPVEPA